VTRWTPTVARKAIYGRWTTSESSVLTEREDEMKTTEELAAEVEAISETVEKLQRERDGFWRFALQYLISPLLVVVLGFVFSWRIEELKQAVEQSSLSVKQAEAAQKMLNELFSDNPERTLIADRLMHKIVEKALADEISQIVKEYLAQKLTSKSPTEARQVTEALDTVGGATAEALRQQLYYVVVSSVAGDNVAEAKRISDKMRARGFSDSEVLRSGNGLLAVTIGHFEIGKARAVMDQFLATAEGEKTGAYLAVGKTFQRL
jgi:hypothetical protein